METGRYVHFEGLNEDGSHYEQDEWVEYSQEDLARLQQLEIEGLKERLAESNDKLLEALEEILGATTLTGLLSVIVGKAKELSSTIKARAELRKQIRELSDKDI